MREGLKNLLKQEGYNNVLDFSHVQETDSDTQDTDLVLLGVDDTDIDELEDTLALIKTHFNAEKIVLLCSKVNQETIVKSFSCGVDGYILKDILPRALITSLKLVMLGEKVFPSSMVSLITRDNTGLIANNTNKKAPNLSKYRFSEREIEIIKCLADGEANKIIAKKLGISESTVKNHLKAILKKLGLSNRTKAAIWAVTNGLSSEALKIPA